MFLSRFECHEFESCSGRYYLLGYQQSNTIQSLIAQRKSAVKTPSVAAMMRKHPTGRWLSPYKPEVTRSKRVGGISSFDSFTEAARHMLSDAKHSNRNRHGAAEARRAHNPEDT